MHAGSLDPGILDLESQSYELGLKTHQVTKIVYYCFIKGL